MRNRRKNNIKNIKDYIVPIITFLVIFLLIYIAFSWWDNSKTENKISAEQNQLDINWIKINFWDDNTQVEILDSKGKKLSNNNWKKLSIWESIIVKSWDISFNIPWKWDFALNTNWKIVYISDNEIELDSSALWIKTNSNEKIKTRYAEVNIWNDSIANIEQNEVSSTVYLLKWTAEVKTLAWKSTFISAWKKITISNKDASNKDLDMELLKQDFDDYFKISDWYIKNNGSVIIDNNTIKNNSGSLTGTGEVKKEKEYSNISGLLNFDNIYDEWTVNSAKTNISWKFSDDRIAKIIINWREAVVNTKNKTFNLVWVDTSKKENDIAIKIYDSEDNLLSKYLYTLYYSNWKKTDTTNWFAKVNSKPYPVNGEDFIINIPKVKNWETTLSEVTFFGTVKNPDVKSVTINWYKLKTFNWKTFRYHAYERFKTLWEWVNNYEIKYYDANWKVILKKYVTINKKSKKIKKENKISQEAKIN